MIVDSGSVSTCCPWSFGSEFPTDEQDEVSLIDVQGTSIASFGSRRVKLKPLDAHGVKDLNMKFDVNTVKKAIACVADMVDADYDVHFSKRGSYIEK